jgi:hypothetical protein
MPSRDRPHTTAALRESHQITAANPDTSEWATLASFAAAAFAKHQLSINVAQHYLVTALAAYVLIHITLSLLVQEASQIPCLPFTSC